MSMPSELMRQQSFAYAPPLWRLRLFPFYRLENFLLRYESFTPCMLHLRVTLASSVVFPSPSSANLVAPGLHLFEEWPSHATHCYAWVNDLDFAALYPTLDMVLNISKQTKDAC